MQSNWIIIAEILIFSGIALGFAFREVWKHKQYKKQKALEAERDGDGN
ncbi:MAG: hypothetical protein ACMVY4_10935 [Minwuia sp.]